MTTRLLLSSGVDYRELPHVLEDHGFPNNPRAGDELYVFENGDTTPYSITVIDAPAEELEPIIDVYALGRVELFSL